MCNNDSIYSTHFLQGFSNLLRNHLLTTIYGLLIEPRYKIKITIIILHQRQQIELAIRSEHMRNYVKYTMCNNDNYNEASG